MSRIITHSRIEKLRSMHLRYYRRASSAFGKLSLWEIMRL